jgi:hypothetical protein
MKTEVMAVLLFFLAFGTAFSQECTQPMESIIPQLRGLVESAEPGPPLKNEDSKMILDWTTKMYQVPDGNNGP